jgi:flagellar motor switch protein FliM
MGVRGRGSVIYRKVQARRNGVDARAMTPAKALRLALARAADGLFDLSLTVATVEQHARPQAELAGLLPQDGLLVLLDGPGGRRGALNLDPQVMAGLVEVQTTGGLRASPPTARRMTPTDAAMAAPFIDAVLSGVDAELESGEGGALAPGFRFGDMVEDSAALALALQAPDYDVFHITVEMGGGAKSGGLTLLLPRLCAPEPGGGVAQSAPPEAPEIEEAALAAPVTLTAEIARLTLPLREATRLAPGQRLTIPRDSLDSTHLLASRGHVVARAQMGKLNGKRAVRLFPRARTEDEGHGAAHKSAADGPEPPAKDPGPAFPVDGDAQEAD